MKECTVKELRRYLKRFHRDAKVTVMIANEEIQRGDALHGEVLVFEVDFTTNYERDGKGEVAVGVRLENDLFNGLKIIKEKGREEKKEGMIN